MCSVCAGRRDPRMPATSPIPREPPKPSRWTISVGDGQLRTEGSCWNVTGRSSCQFSCRMGAAPEVLRVGREGTFMATSSGTGEFPGNSTQFRACRSTLARRDRKAARRMSGRALKQPSNSSVPLRPANLTENRASLHTS